MTVYQVGQTELGMPAIQSDEYGSQLLTGGYCRISHDCQRCRKPIRKGEYAYRPITNGYNRMQRFCVLCVERA